jgi:hypothetical protein
MPSIPADKSSSEKPEAFMQLDPPVLADVVRQTLSTLSAFAPKVSIPNGWRRLWFKRWQNKK